MAIAARARGTSVQLAGKAETTVGTAATGNFAKLPIISFDLSASRPLVADPVLSQGYGRKPPPTYYDKLEVRGTAVVPLDTGNIDFWLNLLAGPIATAGTYTDTYTFGATPISATFEKAFLDVSDYWLYTGVHATGFTLNFAPLGTANLTIPLIGMGSAAMSGSTSAGTVTTATFAPLRLIGSTFSINASAVGNITAGTLTLDNGLDPVYTMDAATTGAPSGVDGGQMSLKGSVTARYDGNTVDGYARAGTSYPVAISIPITGGFALSFNVGQAKFETVSPPISGPGGVEQTINFVGEYDGSPEFFTITRTR